MQSNLVISRRRFLKRTAKQMAAVSAAGYLLPASALGREGNIPPSDKIT